MMFLTVLTEDCFIKKGINKFGSVNIFSVCFDVLESFFYILLPYIKILLAGYDTVIPHCKAKTVKQINNLDI